MKKLIAIFLALTLTFTLSAPVFAGDEPDAPSSAPVDIELTVGQLCPVRELVEGMELEYFDDVSRRTLSKLEVDGAVRLAVDNDYNRFVYGTAVGQGTLTLTFRDDEQLPVTFAFNVTSAVDPIVREIEVKSNLVNGFSVVPQLTELGYTLDDVEHYALWTVRSTGSGSTTVYGPLSSPVIYGENIGLSQFLLNMKDGKIILLNVNLTLDRNREIMQILFLKPAIIFLIPFFWILIPVSPIIIIYQWIVDFSNLDKPVQYHDYTPALVFE